MRLEKNLLFDIYEKMLRIRSFELKAQDLFANHKIPGFMHLYAGVEGVAAAACANLTAKDYITSTHRGHGHLLAKGADVKRLMAELMGKWDGYSRGKGGSMHIADLEIGLLGTNGIVGAGQPIAAGAAFALKYLKSEAVVVSFLGDGASNRGTFHEALNFAASFKLPVIFVCENNQNNCNYQSLASIKSEISDRAKNYGIPGITVDGSDVTLVYEAVNKAVLRARLGEGASLVDCKVWRHNVNFEGAYCSYQKASEQAAWQAKDPIVRLEKKILDYHYGAQSDLTALRAKVEAEIDAAVIFADNSPYPSPSELVTNVWA
ncbi:MAG: thiamine pyrophosphate-dependent dehydrogenase E1 component subunit alpha [Deltaproteobacteria bacterium]|jgi:pyruvate dehydrogenase E1 component alpha subunit|nr:thiamine pyrophosphate-dependent dehydrogenase E1 component subunit alpha [Deltaproteobacteria bacterium]